MSTVSAGKRGEEEAAKFLQSKKYKILARNFRSKFGEVDIVALEGDVLVFIEVKTRWNHEFGYPEESVTPRKLWSITQTGQYFKLINPNTPDLMRVDVVAVELVGDVVIDIRLHQNVTQ